MNKVLKFLSSLKIIIIAGIFLLIQLILMLTKKTFNPYFDFSWITIILCAIPTYYWAIVYLFKYKKIIASTLLSIAITALIIKSFAQNNPHDIFAAAEVAFLSSFGGFFEEKTLKKTRKGLHKLIDLQPKTAHKIVNDKFNTIPIEEIKVGDIVRVLQGERIPVDGVVVNGFSQVDQSIVSGESLPIDKKEGSNVYTATLNMSEPLEIKVTKDVKNSSFARLLQLLKESELKKAKTQRIVDKWAVYIVPSALIIALISFICFYFMGKRDVDGLNNALNRSITVLVVFCPCAMLLATPTAIVAAIGQATKFGLIIKSGHALEIYSKINCICLDKTGTVTEGKLSISKVFTNNISENKLLEKVASAEKNSNHPISKILQNKKEELNLNDLKVENFENIVGQGVKAIIEKELVLCGNQKLIESNDILIPDSFIDKANELRERGEYVIFISVDKELKGLISFKDKIKSQAKEMIQKYKKEGIEVILLSGDDKKTVDYIAKKLEITKAYSNCLPEDKVKIIEDLKNSEKKVAMFGDGINDSAALKISDVSVAFAENGSDIATESADIALCNSKLKNLNYLFDLSKNTFRTILINLSLSITINIVGLVLSLCGLLTPILGALIHQLGTILVILNAAYLYDKKINKDIN